MGALNYTTFDSPVLNHSRVRIFAHRTYQSRAFARELMREAIQRGKFRAWSSVGISLLRREIFRRTPFLKRDTPSPARR